MSIRLEVLSREILERLNALERKVESITIPINEISVEPEPNGQLVPKHIMFGKWGLADENGEMVDIGPYSKDAAIKAAEMVS
jgi:hypothetical protein